MSTTDPSDAPEIASVITDPGICGFPCTINVQKTGKRTVAVEIVGSECKQIQRLAGKLTEMGLKELFLPLTHNPVYVLAEKSGCHASCAIPSAILKAAEVAFAMALPKDVRFQFKNKTERAEDRGTD